MRKLLIASIFVSLCAVDMSAFAAGAVARNKRTGGTSQSTTTTLGASGGTARAAKKTAARAAAPVAGKTTQASIKTTTNTKTTAANGARAATTKKTMAARAGATQKVINMGTKVAKATENTTVSKECQDAFNGCMDTFCMLDNTSGGRCQCSDRNKELDLVLEEIMKLDEQSLAMATEGVERLQMGESADEIMARAKAAADNAIGVKSSSGTGVSNQTKARKLDLNAWKNNSLFAEDDDDVFAADNLLQPGSDDLSSKTGDALQSAAIELCAKQIPAECSASSSFLQLAYAQKIKSDCTAYENSLKQQRSASVEKLQTAQKALRDAALEAYQNENKYDFGQCVTQFKLCMQTTGECGDDYSGCVADTAILDTLYNKKNSKTGVATTAIKTGSTTVTISSATYDILNTKKVMCESVTKQCINANKKGEVWQQVLKDLAPVVYTAEYNAASNNRMNCISTVVKCVQTACGSKWDDDSDNFDACLSDPNSIDNYCKLEYQRCGDGDISGTGTGTMGSVKSYIIAKLAALKVDKCTADIKECLLSEDRCGPDYAGCIGLDIDDIVDLCPADKLISCQNANGENGGRTAEEVHDYIAQVAQGLALNMDNKFATTCQNAVDASYTQVCGDPEAMSYEDIDSQLAAILFPCPAINFTVDEFKNQIKPEFCNSKNVCKQSIDAFTKEEQNNWEIEVKVNGKLDLNALQFDENGAAGLEGDDNKPEQLSKGKYFYVQQSSGLKDDRKQLLESVASLMNQKYISVIGQIESNATVNMCINGRDVQRISSRKDTNREKKDETATRFPGLTKKSYGKVAGQIQNIVVDAYRNALSAANNSVPEMYNEVAKKVKDNAAALDRTNQTVCQSYYRKQNTGEVPIASWDFTGRDTQYSWDSNICTVTIKYHQCRGGYYRSNVSESGNTYVCRNMTLDRTENVCINLTGADESNGKCLSVSEFNAKYGS